MQQTDNVDIEKGLQIPITSEFMNLYDMVFKMANGNAYEMDKISNTKYVDDFILWLANTIRQNKIDKIIIEKNSKQK